MYWHPRGWTTGAWLAIAYITLVLGSVLSGLVFHAGHPDGIVLGYVLAFLVAIVVMPFFFVRPKHPLE